MFQSDFYRDPRGSRSLLRPALLVFVCGGFAVWAYVSIVSATMGDLFGLAAIISALSSAIAAQHFAKKNQPEGEDDARG